MSSLAFSQARVNGKSKAIPFDKTTKNLNNLTGYSYSRVDERWKKSKNIISSAAFSSSQTFNKLIIKTVNYNNSVYYLLIINFREYCENTITFSGTMVNANVGYLFTASEFEQLFNLDQSTKEIFPFGKEKGIGDDVNRSTIYYYDFESLANRVERINARITDDGKMVRFLLPYDPTTILYYKPDVFQRNYFEISKKKFYNWLKPITPQH